MRQIKMLNGKALSLKDQSYDTQFVKGMGNQTFSVLYQYDVNKKNPVVEKLTLRKTLDSALALLLFECKDEISNPIIRIGAGRCFRTDKLSMIATKAYQRYQINPYPESHKIVAALLGAPLSTMDYGQKNIVIDSLDKVAKNMPYEKERLALLATAHIINLSKFRYFVISHAGKAFSEMVLWKKESDKTGHWLPYSEVSKQLVNPVKGPREIEKIYFPTSEDFRKIIERKG